MSIQKPTEDSFARIVLEGDQPVLVEFYAPWCPYCRRIAPAFEAVAKRYENLFRFAQINIDDEPALEDRYQIEVVPTMLLFTGGQLVGTLVNPGSQTEIEAFLQAP